MRIVATVQARMGSTRLPGKTLKPICGKPMLELLVERLKRSKVDDIIIATTVAGTDEVISDLAAEWGVKAFRGSEEDVLSRVLSAAEAFGADMIVEITGDCPLLDPEVVDRCIDCFLANDFDYVSNVVQRTYPRGLDTQVFPVAVLQEVSRKTNDPADREHVSLYIYEHPDEYRLGHVLAPPELTNPDMRWCVDTIEDFQLVEGVYEMLYPTNPEFTSLDVMNLLDERPELAAVNAGISQKKVH